MSALSQALLANRTQVLTRLYRQAFSPVRRYIGRRGGSEQDAQDIFQDALLSFYEQLVGGNLILTAAPATYLLSISRNLWRQELRRRARLPAEPLPEEEDSLLALKYSPPDDPSFPILDYVERLGEKCKSLLLSFYYFQQPLSQLAETHGYNSVRSATVQKFKCLERLRTAVRAALLTTVS